MLLNAYFSVRQKGKVYPASIFGEHSTLWMETKWDNLGLVFVNWPTTPLDLGEDQWWNEGEHSDSDL